jgi:hypothetical protein
MLKRGISHHLIQVVMIYSYTSLNVMQNQESYKKQIVTHCNMKQVQFFHMNFNVHICAR